MWTAWNWDNQPDKRPHFVKVNRMTPNQYMLQVVQQSSSQDNAAIQKVVTDLYPMLQAWAGEYLDKVQFSGSYSKGTAIIGGTDVDLLISLISDTPHSLSDIY